MSTSSRSRHLGMSPIVYDYVLASPNLCARLLPQGSATGAYETVEYQATLTLHDPDGRRATFHRTEQVRFLQTGVTAMLDHYWGDGVPLTDYRHSAGSVGESFREKDRRHLVIDLARPMRRQDLLTIEVQRLALAGFGGDKEWLETAIDRPVQRFEQRILFPPERPCREALLTVGMWIVPLRPVAIDGGRTMLGFDIPYPETNTPYLVRWRW
jgi:hypothetical protein